MKKYIILFFALIINVLANKANAQDLFSSWLSLLHYQESGGKYNGLIANDDFYVSPIGKNNPKSEMDAEIKAFLQTDNKEKCRFPARFMLLKKHDMVVGNLDNCSEYQNFINDVKPKGITLLFTDAYMSNPASLFGHTLIRIDTERKGTQMLAHGSNFGADSGAETGVIFALKGLLGGYDGVFTVSPYWKVINQYNNIENRDIWEYHLNLKDEEKKLFISHLYELQSARIPYFFLNKNCSYMLLEALDAVRPDLQLAKDFRWYAIPSDTLKAVRKNKDLIDQTNYRPARYTQIKKQLAMMNEKQYKAFISGIEESKYDWKFLSDAEKPLVLETLYQYYQYQYTAGNMKLAEYRRNSFAVLKPRSKMPIEQKTEWKGNDPSFSHDSFQLTFAGGVSRHRSFEELTLRPAYTSLTDDHFGLIKGAAVKVLENKWRYYNQRHRLVLQQFTVLNLLSLVPADEIFQPLSYQVEFSLKRIYNPKTLDEGYAADFNTGIGRTYALCNAIWLYGMINVLGEYGGFIPSAQYAALQPELGVFADYENLRLHSKVQKNFATRKFGERLIYQTEIAYGFGKNWAIAGEYKAEHNTKGHNSEEYALSLRWNF